MEKNRIYIFLYLNAQTAQTEKMPKLRAILNEFVGNKSFLNRLFLFRCSAVQQAKVLRFGQQTRFGKRKKE